MKIFSVACWNAALAIALGAFGTHLLKVKLIPDMLAVFKTGQEYHLISSVLVVASSQKVGLEKPSALVMIGGLVFGLSLYLLSLTSVRLWGAVTPLGGVLMIGGLIWMGAKFHQLSVSKM